MKRRQFVKQSVFTGLGLTLGGSLVSSLFSSCGDAQVEVEDFYTLPVLPYKRDALEPFIDAKTMEIHHGKHHAGYVRKLNAEVAKLASPPSDIATLMGQLSADDFALRNNAGGAWNHTFFWQCMQPAKPKAGDEVPEKLAAALTADFGGVRQFKEAFTEAALGLFGSGWVWLLQDINGKLFIETTPNQDNPLMPAAFGVPVGNPILALDVWEHAYYLGYQNHRAGYVQGFWFITNWSFMEDQLM